MTAAAMLDQLDPLSFCVVRIEAHFKSLKLSTATAFFYSGFVDNKPNYWLITNWHVLSGRHSLNAKRTLNPDGAVPNRIRLQLISNKGADGRESQTEIFLHEKFIELYDANGIALWYQHRNKNQIDIALVNVGHFFSEYRIAGINSVANRYDMAIEIGNDVFVLGYPLGFAHFMETPIWKRGSIASEPHLETPSSKDRIIIDATTRAGMSGSPVIMREKTHYVDESRSVVAHVNASRFLGVYSSRPVFQSSAQLSPIALEDETDRRAELGYVFKSGLVDEIIRNGIRGPNFGELP